MFHHHEVNESSFKSSPEILSPHRPPQFNDTNNGCGCRCGMGGVTDGDDGNEGHGEDDNDSTLVGPSDHSDSEDSFPPSSDGPEQHVATNAFEGSSLEDERRRGIVRTKHSMFEIGNDGFRLIEVIPDDIADSIKSEPHGSDDHSEATPDDRSVARTSPGPGMGGWVNNFPSYDDDFRPYKSHFLGGPLRLTPQPRY